jgi:hypothetical protein
MLFSDVPRRSSSRSLSGFRYDNELLMRSAVRRMMSMVGVSVLPDVWLVAVGCFDVFLV